MVTLLFLREIAQGNMKPERFHIYISWGIPISSVSQWTSMPIPRLRALNRVDKASDSIEVFYHTIDRESVSKKIDLDKVYYKSKRHLRIK